MKLIKNADGKDVVQITQDEWLKIGKENKWIKIAQTQIKQESIDNFRVWLKGLSDLVNTLEQLPLSPENLPHLAHSFRQIQQKAREMSESASFLQQLVLQLNDDRTRNGNLI